MKRKRNEPDILCYNVRRLIIIKNCKCHPLYELIFENCNVKKLREIVKSLSVQNGIVSKSQL